MNGISILTQDQLDNAVELVITELCDMFGYEDATELHVIDEDAVTYACEQIGVMATPQVVDEVLRRTEF